MKKILLMLFVAAVLGVTSEKAFAQFNKGDKILNAGIGVGDYGSYGYGAYDYGGGAFYIGASFEYGVSDFISVGGQVDFRPYSYAGYGSHLSIPVAARGSYHFGKHFLKIEKLDLYGVATLGYSIDNNDYDWYGRSSAVVGVAAGGRWYFKPNFGAYAELGGGVNVAPVRLGVTFKF